jgi:hypothetical protein
MIPFTYCLVMYLTMAMHYPSYDCPPPCVVMTAAEWRTEMLPGTMYLFIRKFDDYELGDGRRMP